MFHHADMLCWSLLHPPILRITVCPGSALRKGIGAAACEFQNGAASGQEGRAAPIVGLLMNSHKWPSMKIEGFPHVRRLPFLRDLGG